MSLNAEYWTLSRAARWYLLLQAAAGVLWWIAVASSSDIREWTIGGWNPVVLAVADLTLFVVGSVIVAMRFSRLSAAILVAWTALVTGGLVVYSILEGRAGWGAVIMVAALAGTVTSTAVLWCGHLPVAWLFTGPFRFSEAKNQGPGANLAQSLGQVVVFWTLFLVVIPTALRWFEGRAAIEVDALDRVPIPVGPVIFAAGSALGLWSCFTMSVVGEGTPLPAATARRLVIAGPYRFVRNPMAVAGLVQTIGVGIWTGSWTTVVIGFAGALAWHIAIRPSEERDLAKRFGSDYDQYRASVRCWLPS